MPNQTDHRVLSCLHQIAAEQESLFIQPSRFADIIEELEIDEERFSASIRSLSAYGRLKAPFPMGRNRVLPAAITLLD